MDIVLLPTFCYDYVGNKVGDKMKNIVQELCLYKNEQEWFEFKENWFELDKLGEYISAISNSAVICNKKEGYFIWGINDKTHTIVGTNFNIYQEYKNEPIQNYLARNLNPSINFNFEELYINNKRIVILIIPAATDIPTSYKEKRFIRIGSSKVNLNTYPKREKNLFKLLENGISTIENTCSKYQDLTFSKLFGYYGSKGIILNKNTFKRNLNLLTDNGKYNILAQILSDNSRIPLRVSIFEGETKSSKLFSVRDFGFDCILYSLEELIRYGDVLNIIQSNEQNRLVEREEISLFDNDVFREAIINAVLHNKWIEENEPMITVYKNRMEILSRGCLAPNQTLSGFFAGESIPVNSKLSEIFLQLHISEKSGRGVPKIVDKYGKDAFDFRENSIVVTLPFNWIDERKNNLSNNIKLNANRKNIISEIRNNPNITKKELAKLIGISSTAIDNNISYLRRNGFVIRIGSNKNGYWKILDTD